jgi:hypothetical protein
MTFHAREGRYTSEQLKAKNMETSTGHAPEAVCFATKMCRQRLKNPPLTVDDYIDCLARQQLASTASFLRRNTGLI